MKQITLLKVILITVLGFTSSSCQTVKYGHPGTKVEKEIVSAVYSKNGVNFSYPKDWQIVEDKISEKGVVLISIADIPFCLASIKVLSSEIPMDLRKEAEFVDKKLQRSLDKSFEERVSSVGRDFQNRNNEGVRLRSVFSTNGITIPDTTDFYKIESQKFQALVIISANDADWKNSDKEFQLILDSLKID